VTRPVLRTRAVAGAAALAAALALAACTSSTVGTVQEQPSSSASTSASPSVSGTASGASADPALERFYEQRLSWRGCGGSFQCADLVVPLDYAQPSGSTLKIALLRLKASDPSARLGSLVVDPGGPGGSGVDFARSARAIFDDSIRAHFDIVGLDPRGVQRSDPVTCLGDKALDQFLAVDVTPTTPADVAAIDASAKGFAVACRAKTGPILAHMSTEEAAKDLDVLRAALGEKTLDYFGFSYGTELGATYADLFPTNVGRMVLDGAVDPRLDNTELAHQQLKGFERALARFVADCDTQSDCPLTAGTAPGLDQIRRLLASMSSKALPTDDPARPLTEALAANAILSYLYFPAYGDWDQLRVGLADALHGDGTTLLHMLDDREDRNSAGHYTTNALAAYTAVTALDSGDRPTNAQMATLAQQWSQEAPIFGATFAWSLATYQYWPVPATGHPHAVHAAGAPPILVLGTTYDPATPYPWAQSLAKQLSSGVLLTWIGDGHTAYGTGSDCVDGAVDRYLTRGTTPAAGTVCR
jgi:pimeloyl-ACP methyl ester carboxylesterase